MGGGGWGSGGVEDGMSFCGFVSLGDFMFEWTEHVNEGILDSLHTLVARAFTHMCTSPSRCPPVRCYHSRLGQRTPQLDRWGSIGCTHPEPA